MVRLVITGGQIVPEIEVSSSETVFDLKQKIKLELDVAVVRQSLWYYNRMLRNSQFFDEFSFGTNETIVLTVAPLPPYLKFYVLVKSLGSDGCVRVKETDKVRHLRRKVEKHWGVPAHLIILKRCNVVMYDHFPLYAYYVSEGCEVHLSILIEPR